MSSATLSQDLRNATLTSMIRSKTNLFRSMERHGFNNETESRFLGTMSSEQDINYDDVDGLSKPTKESFEIETGIERRNYSPNNQAYVCPGHIAKYEIRQQEGDGKTYDVAVSEKIVQRLREHVKELGKAENEHDIRLCATCGAKTRSNTEECICQHCSSRMKQDGGNGALTELKAYAQSLAESVKNLLSNTVLTGKKDEVVAPKSPNETEPATKGVQRFSSDPMQNKRKSIGNLNVRSASLNFQDTQDNRTLCVYPQNKHKDSKPSITPPRFSSKFSSSKGVVRGMTITYSAERGQKSVFTGNDDVLFYKKRDLCGEIYDNESRRNESSKTGMNIRSKTYGSRMGKIRNDRNSKTEIDMTLKRNLKIDRINRMQKLSTFDHSQMTAAKKEQLCEGTSLTSDRQVSDEGSSVDPPVNVTEYRISNRNPSFLQNRTTSQRAFGRGSSSRGNRSGRTLSLIDVKSSSKTDLNLKKTVNSSAADSDSENFKRSKDDQTLEKITHKAPVIFWKGESEGRNSRSKSATRESHNAKSVSFRRSSTPPVSENALRLCNRSKMRICSNDESQFVMDHETLHDSIQGCLYPGAGDKQNPSATEQSNNQIQSLYFSVHNCDQAELNNERSNESDYSLERYSDDTIKAEAYFGAEEGVTCDQEYIKDKISQHKPNEDDLYHVKTTRSLIVTSNTDSESQWYEGSLLKTSLKAHESNSDASQTRSSVYVENSGLGLSLVKGDGINGYHNLRYSETDVDTGNIYHVAKRISPTVSCHYEYKPSNFFDLLESGSRSNSSVSVISDKSDLYTGNFFNNDPFYNNKSISSSSSGESQIYFETVKSKTESDQDLYTGAIFNRSDNSLAMNTPQDNWRNISTNNSNHIHKLRCRLTRTASRGIRGQALNCSNNSSNWNRVGYQDYRKDSGQANRKSRDVIDMGYEIYKNMRPEIFKSKTKARAESVVKDFSKYDRISEEHAKCFLAMPQTCSVGRAIEYAGQASQLMLDDLERHDSRYSFQGKVIDERSEMEDTYTDDVCPKYKSSSTDFPSPSCNSNNNSLGDFYSNDYATGMSGPKDYSKSYSTQSYQENPASPKPQNNFFESDYSSFNSQSRSGSPYQNPFESYMHEDQPKYRKGEILPPPHTSPNWSKYDSPSALSESMEASVYADDMFGMNRHCGNAIKCTSEACSYFDHTPNEEASFSQAEKLPVTAPVLPIKKMVGNIICRENVANKDDYAENINRDLADDVWSPIVYKPDGPRVKEMSSTWKNQEEVFKTREAVGGLQLHGESTDWHPLCQDQIKNFGLDGAGCFGDAPPLKWKEARDEHFRQRESSKNKESSKSTALWRPSDHIPEKARGKRVITKKESRSNQEEQSSGKVWSVVTWVPSKVGTIVKKLW